MSDKNDSCRICLGSGAEFPLFTNSESEDCNLLTQLTLCINEKIEDIEGYPKCICKNCYDTIQTICSFINTYKESSKILESRLLAVKDEKCESDPVKPEVEKIEVDIKNELDNDDDYIVVNDSDNPEESLPVIELKVEKVDKTEDTPKTAKSKRPKRLTIKARSTKKDINKIASSILEGDFAWIGDVWCIKSTRPVGLKENRTPKPRKPKESKVPIEPKTPKEPPTRLCDICGEIFKDQEKLNVHKKKVHFKQPTKCPHCPRLLVSQYYLNRHLKRRHYSEAKNFMCPTCGRAFAYKGELTTHIRNVHNKHLKPKKIYTCKICNKNYKCAKSVLVHERSVHTGLRPAVCEICGTSFFHIDYLKEHMRLHTGETPFKCPICGRGYAQRSNMKSHLRIHRVSELDANTLSKIRPNYLKLLKV